MDDPEWIKSYEDTFSGLTSVYKMSKHKIPCKPIMKIVENEIVVGIITQTNQFVPVNPEGNEDEGDVDVNGLKVVKMNSGVKNYLAVDNEIREMDDVDRERINAVNNKLNHE